MALSVGLIGLGMVSGTYAEALAELEGRVLLRGVHARSPDRRSDFLDAQRVRFPTARAYASVAEMAADPGLDAVILTTPPDARAEIVATLAAAGKPILMEKPVERTHAAAQALCKICEDAGVPLGIMLQHRARPAARALKERVDSGALGPLRAVEVAVPWWRDQAYYDAPGRGSYGRDGGGVLISQAIHTLDLMLDLAGPVDAVTALTAKTGFHDMEAEDFVSAGLWFRNGAVGSLLGSTATYPGRSESIRLHYAKGSATLVGNALTIAWQDGRQESLGASGATGAGADPMAFTADWHRDVIADFADALNEGRPPMVPGRAALEVHALIEALVKSGRTGARVDLGGAQSWR